MHLSVYSVTVEVEQFCKFSERSKQRVCSQFILNGWVAECESCCVTAKHTVGACWKLSELVQRGHISLYKAVPGLGVSKSDRTKAKLYSKTFSTGQTGEVVLKILDAIKVAGICGSRKLTTFVNILNDLYPACPMINAAGSIVVNEIRGLSRIEERRNVLVEKNLVTRARTGALAMFACRGVCLEESDCPTVTVLAKTLLSIQPRAARVAFNVVRTQSHFEPIVKNETSISAEELSSLYSSAQFQLGEYFPVLKSAIFSGTLLERETVVPIEIALHNITFGDQGRFRRTATTALASQLQKMTVEQFKLEHVAWTTQILQEDPSYNTIGTSPQIIEKVLPQFSPEAIKDLCEVDRPQDMRFSLVVLSNLCERGLLRETELIQKNQSQVLFQSFTGQSVDETVNRLRFDQFNITKFRVEISKHVANGQIALTPFGSTHTLVHTIKNGHVSLGRSKASKVFVLYGLDNDLSSTEECDIPNEYVVPYIQDMTFGPVAKFSRSRNAVKEVDPKIEASESFSKFEEAFLKNDFDALCASARAIKGADQKSKPGWINCLSRLIEQLSKVPIAETIQEEGEEVEDECA